MSDDIRPAQPKPLALMNTPQLAERWHMAVGTIQNMRSAGTGPQYIKVGARVLYDLAAIEAYEAARVLGGDR
ncbi:helix-turn-helix transcriptional regulator [Blastococcus sp. SYSU DS0973]